MVSQPGIHEIDERNDTNETDPHGERKRWLF